MKIAIVTFFDGPLRQLGLLTLPNKKAYANKHNYDLIVHEVSLAGLRASAWTKDVSVMRALDNYDVVFWTDADSIFMDMDRRIEDMLEPEVDFVVGSVDGTINNGNFIIRNSREAKQFMRDVWKLPEQEEAFAHLAAPDAKKWSQTCMMEL